MLQYLLFPFKYALYLIKLAFWKANNIPRNPAHSRSSRVLGRRPRYLLLFASVFLVALLPLAYYVTTRPQSTEAIWYHDQWMYRKEITINSSEVSGSSDHTDFPVMVELTDDTDLRDYAQSDGDDLLFTNADHVKLDHEIEKYTSTDADLVAWVRIPSLSPDNDTTIYLYYGNPSASNQQNPQAVWDNNFVMVHHLEETGTTDYDYKDSTANNQDSNDVSFGGTGSSADATGIADGANQFDATDDYIGLPDHPSLTPAAEITTEVWVNFDTLPSTQPANTDAIGKWHSGSPYHSYFIDFLYSGGDANKPRWAWKDSTEASYYTIGPDAVTTGTWYHIAGTRTGSTLKIHVNGSSTSFGGTPPSSGESLFDSTSSFYIGGVGDANTMDAILDEIRISNVARSDDWLTTTYNTISDNASFITTGSQEIGPGPIAYWKFDEGVDNTCANATDDACDATANRNDLAKTNAVWQTEDLCVWGKCLFFDGTGDYLSRADDLDFDFAATDSFTISGWFRHGTQTSGQDVIIAKHTASGSDGGFKILMESDGDITCGIDDDDTWGPDAYVTSTAATYDDNQWHHVSCVKDSDSTLYLYLDGRLIGSASISSIGSLANSDTLYLGIDGDGSSNGWTGFLDDFIVYPSVRTADQIKSDYVGGAAVMGKSDQSGDFLSNGLIGYWKFDEGTDGTGQTVYDSSGNGHNGTTGGSSSVTMAPIGKYRHSIIFDGTDDYVSFSSTPSVSSTGKITLSAWIRRYGAADNFDRIISYGYGDNSDEYGFRFDDSGSGVHGITYIDGIATNTNVITIPDLTWVHLTMTYDGKKLNYYYNGDLYSSQDIIGSITTPSSSALGFARRVDGNVNHYSGKLDEVRLYNRALSEKEVEGLYNWAPGPIGYWKMDEGSGTSTTFDSSGNGYNGTLMSITANSWIPGKFGNALKLDGSADYIQIADNSDLTFGNIYGDKALTISAWVYVDSSGTSNRVIASKYDHNTPDREWIFRVGNPGSNELDFQIWDDSTGGYLSAATTDNIATDQWTYVSVTYDAINHAVSDIKFYENGILMPSTDNGSSGSYVSMENTIEEVRIGSIIVSGSASQLFKGAIDEVKIYQYARTPGQIVQDMNADHPAPGSPIGSQVAHWRFDDMSGSSAQDSGPHNQDLTLVNTPTWTTTGKINQALSFASATWEYGYAADSAALSLTGSLSLSAWIKPESNTASTFYNIAGKWDGANESYLLTQYGDEIRFYIDSGSYFIETTDLNIQTGTWYHVAGVYDSALQTMNIYINGKSWPTSSATPPSSIGDDSGLFHVGAAHSSTSASDFFNGTIDEVKLYSSALTPSQVILDYNSGLATNFGVGAASEASTLDDGQATPNSYFPLNDNTGTSATYDKSGNGYTGTLTSITGESWVPGKYGSALKLDGSADYIDIGTGPSSVKTVSFWVYPQTTTEYFINLTSTTDYIWSNAGTLTATGFSDPTIYINGTPSTTLSANTWSHVVVTTDTAENASNFDIGRTADSNYLEGTIDEVKTFSTALTPAQVAYDYNRGLPVAHYKFDECSGATAYDSSPNANHATIEPGDTSGDNDTVGTCTGSAGEIRADGATGKFSAALDFDGTNDYVYITNTSAHNMASRDFSLSTWFKTSSAATGNIVGKGSTYTGGKRYQINLNDTGDCAAGKIKVEIDDNTTKKFVCSSSSSLNDNSWHHAVMVRNGNDLNLYIDGQIDPNSPADITSYGDIDSARDFYIGAIYQEGGGIRDYFTGLIDDVRLFNYALSPSQIKQVMNGGFGSRFGPNTGSP